MLNREALLAGIKLWAYGPAGIPGFDLRLPVHACSLEEPASSLQSPLDDRRFDLDADCQILKDYQELAEVGNHRPLQILSAVGSADLTCISNRRMTAALRALPAGSVAHEYREVSCAR